ncbi:MAG: MATE family efflux transporter [Hyphomicrobiales bacterium]
MEDLPASAPLSLQVKRTFGFALPIVVARSAILIMFTVDTMMTGWSGARELAYLGLGLAPQLSLMLIAIGLLTSTVVLASQAFGAGEHARCGDIWRTGLAHAVVLGAAIYALSLLAGPFFLVTGQDPEIAAGAARVTRVFAMSVPGMLLYVTTNLFLEATGRQRVGMMVMLVANVLNVPLNGIFALGWGGFVEPMGAVGAVATSAALRWLAFAAVVVFAFVAAGRDDEFGARAPLAVWARSFLTLGGPNGRAMRRLGLPIGLAQGIESAAFATVVLIAGHLGEKALAAHQLTMLLVTLIFMNAVGMSGATSIRVGRAVGRGDAPAVRIAGWIGVGLGAAIALPFAAAYIALPREIAGLFVADETVLGYAGETVRVAGVILVFDAMMVVTMGALRGAGDVWVPLGLQASAFWLAMLPTAYVLAFGLGFGPVGLIGGILVGILASLTLLFPRFNAVSKRPPRRIRH